MCPQWPSGRGNWWRRGQAVSAHFPSIFVTWVMVARPAHSTVPPPRAPARPAYGTRRAKFKWDELVTGGHRQGMWTAWSVNHTFVTVTLWKMSSFLHEKIDSAVCLVMLSNLMIVSAPPFGFSLPNYYLKILYITYQFTYLYICFNLLLIWDKFPRLYGYELKHLPFRLLPLWSAKSAIDKCYLISPQ